jgi:hypothetical protein
MMVLTGSLSIGGVNVPVAAIEVGPLCECGCGERLPVGSARKYKRGHKAEANRQLADQMEANGVFDGYNFRSDIPYNTEPIDPYIFVANSDAAGFNGTGWETIQDAAAGTPNDPEGANFWENADGTQIPQFEFKIPRGVARDVEGKVAFMLSTTGMAIGLVDDYCGNSILQNTPKIAKALTPVLCQSPGVVAWFTKTSNIMLYVNLAMALAPVVMAVASHHLPGPKAEAVPDPGNGQMNINPNMYAVQ